MLHSWGVNKRLQEHLLTISGQTSVRALAQSIGMEPSTLQRQLAGDVKVETVVNTCRKYGAPLLPAFVAAGFITEGEAAGMGGSATLSLASDKELAQEILRRAN